jgi:hypothetical protein
MRVFIPYLFQKMRKNVKDVLFNVRTCLMLEKSLTMLGSFPSAYFPGLILKSL